MTKEEYADYAITFLYLRGGPMPQVTNPWAITRAGKHHDAQVTWGVKHTNKASQGKPQWDRLGPAYWVRCNSRREAALRYCWKHGLIKRNRKKHPWTEEDLQNLRDPDGLLVR